MAGSLDAYEVQARLSPGLLAVLPVSITVLGLGLESVPVISSIAGLLSAAGGPFLLADFVRSRGSDLQEGLYREWGGPPTTYLLRLRAPSSNAVLRDRWRKAVSSQPGLELLGAEDEVARPAEADQRIETAVADARERSRNSNTYGLVAAENRHYGFSRNLRGMRPVGIVVAVLGLAVAVVGLLVGLTSDDGPSAGVTVAAVANAAWLVGWCVLPTTGSVRRAAERYAAQLFNSVTSLGGG